MCGNWQVFFSNTFYFYCNLFCYLLTYLFTYLFFYFLLCINVVNLLSTKKKIIIIIINWHILVDHDDIRRVTTVKKKAGTDNNNNPRWFAQRQSATAVNSFLKNSVFSPFFQASPAKTKGIDLGSEYWTTAIFKVFCSQNFKSPLL